MAWYEGSLYVSHMPFLTVIRDTDGDGTADARKDLFTDLGPTNNQGLNDHIVSGIQFGIDNHLYIATGDKGVLKATGPDGKTAQLIGGGTLRCKPDGTEIEVFSTGTRNHLEPNLDAKDKSSSSPTTTPTTATAGGPALPTTSTAAITAIPTTIKQPLRPLPQPDRRVCAAARPAAGSSTRRRRPGPEKYRGRK